MSSLLNQFEQFLALFENLKTVAGEPKRLATFYSVSSAVRDAAKTASIDFARYFAASISSMSFFKSSLTSALSVVPFD
jgi:hypothetical protein